MWLIIDIPTDRILQEIPGTMADARRALTEWQNRGRRVRMEWDPLYAAKTKPPAATPF